MINEIWSAFKNTFVLVVNIVYLPLILTSLIGCIIGFIVSLIALEILSSLAFVFLFLVGLNLLEMAVRKQKENK